MLISYMISQLVSSLVLLVITTTLWHLLDICHVLNMLKHTYDWNTAWSYGPDRMEIVRFITTYAINAYHHYRCEFEPHAGDVYSIQHNVIMFSVTCGRSAVSPGTLVSSTIKTDCHDMTEILLKMALNTIIINHLS